MTTPLVALACWRSALRTSWRQATALALIAGLLGGVALGAVAGARRTATAYSRYLTSINASDVFVNVPGRLPGMPRRSRSRSSPPCPAWSPTPPTSA